MTTKNKRPPERMNVQQAAVHSAFEIAHQRVLAAQAAAEREGLKDVSPAALREWVDSLRARATQWDRIWSAYVHDTHVHKHLRAAPMFAAQRDRQIADEFEQALKRGSE